MAFEVAAENPPDLPAIVRRRTRDAMVKNKILKRMVHDISWLLSDKEELPKESEDSIVYLWDDIFGTVPNGISYAMS